MAEERSHYMLQKETLTAYLNAVTQEVYSKNPTEFHFSVDAELDSIPEMSVQYKTLVLPVRKNYRDKDGNLHSEYCGKIETSEDKEE